MPFTDTGTPHQTFGQGDRTIATLLRDGRIRFLGEATPSLPSVGYAAPPPSTRLLDALAALLACDIGAEVVPA